MLATSVRIPLLWMPPPKPNFDAVVTVSDLIVTTLPASIETVLAGKGESGNARIVAPAPAPTKVTLLLIATPSRYVPAAMLIVAPLGAAFTAAWTLV